MRRVSQIVFGAVVGILAAACSPACNPPDAKAPGDQGRGPKGNANARPGSKKAEDLAAHEEKRQALPKDDMIMEAPGVDTSKLSEAQRGVFFQIINTEPSACDKPHSIARSLKDDPDCRDSMLVAQFVADTLASGGATSAVKHDVPIVVAALKPKQFALEGRPVYGSERAPVTVVVFADFTCPHCRAEAPVLRKAIDQFRGRARLIYKHFPLVGPGHDFSKPASLATMAAHEQGKFWEMHDAVFENQRVLSEEKIYELAQGVGLDMAKFKAAYSAGKYRDLIEQDKADGEKAGIGGTPAVYVNGREVTPALFGGNVNAYIDDALKR